MKEDVRVFNNQNVQYNDIDETRKTGNPNACPVPLGAFSGTGQGE